MSRWELVRGGAYAVGGAAFMGGTAALVFGARGAGTAGNAVWGLGASDWIQVAGGGVNLLLFAVAIDALVHAHEESRDGAAATRAAQKTSAAAVGEAARAAEAAGRSAAAAERLAAIEARRMRSERLRALNEVTGAVEWALQRQRAAEIASWSGGASGSGMSSGPLGGPPAEHWIERGRLRGSLLLEMRECLHPARPAAAAVGVEAATLLGRAMAEFGRAETPVLLEGVVDSPGEMPGKAHCEARAAHDGVCESAVAAAVGHLLQLRAIVDAARAVVLASLEASAGDSVAGGGIPARA